MLEVTSKHLEQVTLINDIKLQKCNLV